MPTGWDTTSIHQANIVAAGISAGFTGTIFGHPLDLIKVRLQARSEYKGTIDCISKTVRNDGLRGMFRGISSPLFGLTVLNAITFGSYNKFNKIQQSALMKFRRDFTQTPTLEFYNHFVSGAGVGVICSAFSCPFEVIKVRMQLDGRAAAAANANIASSSSTTSSCTAARKYTGFFDCGNKIWKQDKFGGFYQGFLPTTIRDVSFCATYFAVYEVLKKFLQSKPMFTKPGVEGGGFSPIPIIISGGMSGAVAWVVSFPLDAVKTTMQDNQKVEPSSKVGANNNNVHNNTYNNNTSCNNDCKKVGMISVAKRHYAQVGIKGFYTGLTPAIFRAFLVSSVRFFTFESVLYLLNNNIKKLP